MKTFNRLILMLICVFSLIPAYGASYETDNEGMPVMYLRGEVNGWATQDAYRFTRDGSRYTINLSGLNGEFKVSNSDWTLNLGDGKPVTPITTSIALQGVPDGANFEAKNLTNVKIWFDFGMEGGGIKPATVYISVNGGDPGEVGLPDQSNMLSGTLPVLYINAYKVDESGKFIEDASGNRTFENELIDYNLGHKNYFKAEYWLDLNGCQWMTDLGAKSVGSKEEPLPLDIKARGNWTRTGFSKKPFKLKLGKKQNLLNLTPDKSKHYAILAHADDYLGYLRNFVGFNLAKRIGLPWAPSQQPIEVIINGDYRGIYFLTESIRVGDGRVDITELKDNETTATLISGGYLIEIDNYDENNQIRLEEKSSVGGHYLDVLRVTYDTPEEYSELQKRFVTDQFTAMNDYVGQNSDDLWSYLDMDDAARYYIVREMMSDVEAYHGSTYLFRDYGDGQKWHFSPIWDCGNAFNGPTDDFFYNHDPYGNTWIPSMRENKKFNDKVKETWLWFMSNCYDGLIADIDTYIGHLGEAAKADYNRWNGVTPPNGSFASVVDNRNIQNCRNNAVNKLESKISWLKGKFGDYTRGNYSEPARDLTPAAILPDYAATGVEEVTVNGQVDGAVEWFNLQGMRVSSPAPGQIVIRRQGNDVRKMIVR